MIRIPSLFFSILLIFIIVACGYEPEAGLGVLHFEDDQTYRLNFHDHPDTASRLAFYVDLRYDSLKRSIRTSLRKKDTLDFYPLYSISGASIIVLQVLEQKGDWYRVITDDDVVPVSHWLYSPDQGMERWRWFFPKVKWVKTYDDQRNPLREGPSPKARSYGLNRESVCLQVLEVQGAWLKVKNTPERCPKAPVIQEPFEGYLRWKKEGQILVWFAL